MKNFYARLTAADALFRPQPEWGQRTQTELAPSRRREWVITNRPRICCRCSCLQSRSKEHACTGGDPQLRCTFNAENMNLHPVRPQVPVWFLIPLTHLWVLIRFCYKNTRRFLLIVVSPAVLAGMFLPDSSCFPYSVHGNDCVWIGCPGVLDIRHSQNPARLWDWKLFSPLQ